MRRGGRSKRRPAPFRPDLARAPPDGRHTLLDRHGRACRAGVWWCGGRTALVLFKRNLLYVYTHKSETRGSFFVAASSNLCLVLGTAQLLLAAVHASKLSWISFGCTLPLLYITWRTNRSLQRAYTPLLAQLPLADADSGQFTARKSTRHSHTSMQGLAGTSYMQPELVHPLIADEARMAELIAASCATSRVDDEGAKQLASSATIASSIADDHSLADVNVADESSAKGLDQVEVATSPAMVEIDVKVAVAP